MQLKILVQVVQELQLTREDRWERGRILHIDWSYAPINEILVGWGWEEVNVQIESCENWMPVQNRRLDPTLYMVCARQIAAPRQNSPPVRFIVMGVKCSSQ